MFRNFGYAMPGLCTRSSCVLLEHSVLCWCFNAKYDRFVWAYNSFVICPFESQWRKHNGEVNYLLLPLFAFRYGKTCLFLALLMLYLSALYFYKKSHFEAMNKYIVDLFVHKSSRYLNYEQIRYTNMINVQFRLQQGILYIR